MGSSVSTLQSTPQGCPTTDNSTFIDDITIPDGSVLSPDESFTKTWRMKNTGTSTWGSGYQLAFIDGNQMGGPSAVGVPPISPGQEVNIGVNLTSPSSDGTHTGYWQLRNPQGTYFGPKIWVTINVHSQPAPSPEDPKFALTAGPASPSDAATVRIRARVENFPNFRAMRLKIDNNVVYEIGAPELAYDWETSGYNAGDHSIVVEVADQTDTSWSHPELAATTYTLQGSSAPANHAPNRPDPESPYDWYVYYSGNTARLCATANGDPDGDPITGYQFDIFESAQLYNSGWVGSNCVTTDALGPYNYQWRVRVRDDKGAQSEWSEPWHFTIVNPNLEITELYFEPQDGNSEQVKIRACTEGQGGVGITMRVSVNDASDGTDSGDWHIIKELGVPCFNEVDAPVWKTLPYGDGQHLVRVEAHGADASWDGATVREATYTLPHRRPAQPHLVAPVPPSEELRDPVYLNSRTVTFRWDPTIRAQNYTLHVSTSPSPKDDSSPLFRQTFGTDTTEHTVTFDQDYGTLYWQVTATNDIGSKASGDQQFGIDRTAPTCTVQNLDEVIYESVFQVDWGGGDNKAGIRSFDIQYLTIQKTWKDWLTDVPASKTFALFSGKAGHAYAFRCRATDQANNAGDYPADPDTSTAVDPTARPETPWWDTAYAHKRNLTILNNMSGVTLPAGYPVHLHFNGATTPTAAELYSASQSDPKCNDLRVVHNDTTEMDRVVASCTSSAIDIWFRSRVDIAGGSSNNTAHQLYYGNPAAGAPPADPNQVWYPYREGDTEELYFFQEGSGSTAHDASGNGRDCSLDSSVQWAPAKFGDGLRFKRTNDGESRSLTCNNAPGLSSFSVEFWYKADSDDEGRIAGQLGASGQLNWLLQNLGGQIRLDVWPCPGCGSSEVHSNFNLRDAPYAGNWNHIGVTFNGGDEVKFYINGTRDSTKHLSQSGLNTYDVPLEIGSVEGIKQIKANMGAFRISRGVKSGFPYGAFGNITNEPTTAAGNPIDPPVAGAPDLVVQDLSVYPHPDGGKIVQVVVQNQGDLATQNEFYTGVYFDPPPSGEGLLKFWIDNPIAAGETVALTTVITDQSILSGAALQAAETTEEISGTVYAQTDFVGLISESDNENNYSEGTEVCFASQDAFEGNDSVQDAKALPVGQIQTHNVDSPGDQDWMKFEAQAGTAYVLGTSDLGPSADTYLNLYDTDGATLLASNDDHAGSLASRLEWTAPADGTYYVMVEHWNPNAGGCGTTYNLSIKLRFDLDNTCAVDAADVQNEADLWRQEESWPFDCNGDGVITVEDIMCVVAAWGDRCQRRPIEFVGRYDTPGSAEGVFVLGNYAYIADASGLRIIDASNPATPEEVGVYTLPQDDLPRRVNDVHVTGNYAYLTDIYSLRVLDISNPTTPVEIGAAPVPFWAYDVQVSGNYAYVAASFAGLVVYDISNPATPEEVGAYAASDPDGVRLGSTVNIHIVGNYAYVADEDGGLRVVDISDPTNPIGVGSFDTPDWAYDIYNDVYVANNYAYLAYTSGTPSPGPPVGGMRVVDVSNPPNPVGVSAYDMPEGSVGVYVAEDYAYLAAGPYGIRALDVSNPATPEEVGVYDTPDIANNVYVAANYIYVADGINGLVILQFTGGRPGLSISHIEVTQGIQCLDNPRCLGEAHQDWCSTEDCTNAVPLLLNQPTWAQIHVRNNMGEEVGVTGLLYWVL